MCKYLGFHLLNCGVGQPWCGLAFELHVGGVFSVGYSLSYTFVGVQSWGGSKVVAFQLHVDGKFIFGSIFMGLGFSFTLTM